MSLTVYQLFVFQVNIYCVVLTSNATPNLGILWYLVFLWYSRVTFSGRFFIVRLHFWRHFELAHFVHAHQPGSIKVIQIRDYATEFRKDRVILSVIATSQ